MGFGDFFSIPGNTGELNEDLDPLDLFGGQANRLATGIQAQLADIGLQLERDLFSQLREDEAPVRGARNQALDFLRGIEQGTSTLPQDPSLDFRRSNALRDIGQNAAARGKFFSGGRLKAEQDALGSLESQDVNSQLSRLLNLAGFETGDLLGSNQLIAANTDSQANQMQNANAIRGARDVGRSNALFSFLNQGSQVAGSAPRFSG
jgi:hypothetical protein